MKIVIALGGNALGKNPEEQLSLVKKTAKTIVDLVEEGHKVVVSHGNGPQVGMINLAMDFSSEKGAGTPDMPFAECGAMSQGYIGYHLQQAIQNELTLRRMEQECITVVTQVLVDKKDKAFNNPTKPVGMFYSENEAKKIAKENGYIMKEDAGRGFRRVVPSPFPKEIIELETIESLVNEGKIVITCGGGGIPVIKERNRYKGIDAVIDKDNSSCRLAIDLNADMLMILTAVDKVCINYNKENEQALNEISLEDAKRYIKEGQFAKGSMLPKVEASIKFVEETGKKAVITSLLKAKEALLGENGTVINDENRINLGNQKRKKMVISSLMILMAITIFLGLVTYFLPEATFVDADIIDGSGIIRAKLYDILMAPILGFENIISLSLFLLVLGGFINLVLKNNVIQSWLKKFSQSLIGKELIFITITMTIFSVFGLFNFFEEMIIFYVIFGILAYLLKLDPLIGISMVLFGTGSGLLGSGINQLINGDFTILLDETIISSEIIIILSIIMWLGSLIISLYFILKYAEKLLNKQSLSRLSLDEENEFVEKFIVSDNQHFQKSSKKWPLFIICLSLIVLILGFIPWSNWNITFFNEWSSILTGESFGNWNYYDASLWLVLMAIIFGFVSQLNEKDMVKLFVDGTAKMLKTVLIISFAYGIIMLVQKTHLDNYLLYNFVKVMENYSLVVFVPLNYLLNIIMSVFNSDIYDILNATVPAVNSLVTDLNINKELIYVSAVSANGVVKLIMPTSLMLMSGITINDIEYSTWFKWAFKIVSCILIFSIIVLTMAAIIL